MWHRGLLLKLYTAGVRDSLLEWFSSYLSKRKQRVVLNNSYSNWRTITSGVPQGSILGPLLFLLYINDIVKEIRSNIRLFADDTSLYLVVEDPQSCSTILNTDLEKIHSWAETWLVDFNSNKTETILFSRKRNRPNHPNLIMNNTVIKNVQEHKHLGIIFSNDGKWGPHISSIVSRAWKRIGILRFFKFKLGRKSLEKMYLSFIRPLLEYSDSLWDNCSDELKRELESVQIEAARIVTGATKLCSINNLYNELKWELLSTRRRKHKLILFYKMKNELCPTYLNNLIPNNPNNRYQFRNTTIPSIQCRSELYRNSFLPSVIIEWNQLPVDVKTSQSLSIFKHKLNLHLPKPPLYFNIGSREGQVLHARIRLGCSALNFDLHRKSIINSPLCRCGAIETPTHYLLLCPLYHTQRLRYLSNLPCPLLLNNLIYGNDNLTVEQNKYVFYKVQQYLTASKRFSA